MLELSLNILDIVENSIRANAKLIRIEIIEDRANDSLKIEISDNGDGISEEYIEEALNPFYTSKTVRRVGLGLPLLSHAAGITGGSLSIESKKGNGTKVTAVFGHSHIDRQPLGDMEITIATLLSANPEIDFIYSHFNDGRVFVLDTREVKDELDDIPINHPKVIQFLKKNIGDGLKEIGAGS